MNRGDRIWFFITIAGICILLGCIIYWVIKINMENFEILFGNGWWYIGVLILGMVGSLINVPFYKRNNTTLYINVGGGVIPVIIVYFLCRKYLSYFRVLHFLIALLIMIIISRLLSFYVREKGVVLVGLGVIISTLIITHFMNFYSQKENLLALKLSFGYIVSTLGVIIGGDILHLPQIFRDPEVPDKLSIGGAGTSDGIWVVGMAVMFFINLFNL